MGWSSESDTDFFGTVLWGADCCLQYELRSYDLSGAWCFFVGDYWFVEVGE